SASLPARFSTQKSHSTPGTGDGIISKGGSSNSRTSPRRWRETMTNGRAHFGQDPTELLMPQ
ncbi:MAG: hypothetical protein AAB354_07150, partial [candidate division KSB1 bacterium]